MNVHSVPNFLVYALFFYCIFYIKGLMQNLETDMPTKIFQATEQLMAEGGLQSLSMQKIAKKANISAGTIYLYFKNKDELLSQLAERIFHTFEQAIQQDYDETQSLFEQYRKIWWNLWNLLQQEPNLVINMSQYRSLPNFYQACKESEKQSIWRIFCKKGVQAGELIDLPANALFILSLRTVINMAFDCVFFKRSLSDEHLESIILCSFKAIQK